MFDLFEKLHDLRRFCGLDLVNLQGAQALGADESEEPSRKRGWLKLKC